MLTTTAAPLAPQPSSDAAGAHDGQSGARSQHTPMDDTDSKAAEPAAAVGTTHDEANDQQRPTPPPPTATTAPAMASAPIKPPSPAGPPALSAPDGATGPPAEGAKEVRGVRWQEPLLSAQKEVVLSKPHHSQDLVTLYHVSGTTSRVARFDPTTGEKINRLRKSYEGQIKSFQLAGRNKSVKYEGAAQGMGLLEMASWPDFEWQNQKVGERKVSRGLSDTAQAQLEKALKLEPGPVPRNDEWESILGHEKVKPSGPPSPKPGNRAFDGAAAKKPAKLNGLANGTAQEQADVTRARRSGKRRRYDDDSFEGYGEGFVDDDRDDGGGYSSDERSSKKKRRKDFNSGASGMGAYGMAVPRQSIGSGIGAFGAR